MENARVLGLVEIADLLDVDKRTPHAWFYRGLMPAPDHDSVNGGRAWDRPTVIAWAARTGRLPEHLHGEVPDGVEVAVKRGGRAAKAALAVEKGDD